jgi:predicted polyphosphate/ATP-dependent NAD kinase
MRDLGVDLLLFAGGDGTARDVCDSIGEDLPALGIPAGVKIHSAVYATNPLNAGELAALFLDGRVSALRAAEVMDIDEEAVRRGRISARLYGYLRVPWRTSLVQSLKSASGPGEEAAMDAIAAAIVESMDPNSLYLIGPGTTTRAILARLGLQKTLIGVDAVEGGELVASDLGEARILSLIEGRESKVVVTPVGGQGCIFGRGNQQLSPEVLSRIGPGNVIVVSTQEKINSLGGKPLWVDTGDREVDAMLSGHVRVVTGYKEEAVCRVSS